MRILNLFLFFVCGCLLTLGGYYLYFEMAKAPGQEAKEVQVQILHEDETALKADKFEDKKPANDKTTPESYTKKFDINDTDAPVVGDMEELKMQIRVLRAQNKLLYDDNVDLVAKNLEISNLFNLQKTELETRRKKAENSNERQLLGKIDELNKKLAKAQSENLEQNLTSLKNEIKILKDELAKKQEEFDKFSSKTAGKSDKKLKELEAQNDDLKTKLQDQRAKFESDLGGASEELAKLKSENRRLNDELSMEQSKLKRVLSEHNSEILNLQNANKNRILVLENEQNLTRKKVAELENSLQKANENAKIITKLKMQNSELNATNSQLVAKIEKQKQGFESEISKIWTLHKEEQEKSKTALENEQKSSQEKQAVLEAKFKELEGLNLKKDEELASLKAKNLELNESLKVQKELLADEIAAGKKNIENYKILNNKITTLIENNLKTSKQDKDQIDALNMVILKKDEELARLTKQLKEASQRKEKGAKESQASVANDEIAQILDKNEELASENENLRKIIQLNFKAEVPRKVTFIASVECSDMSAGSDKPTQICKNKVGDFLQTYNANYYFEITPIVSQGNFIATSKAAKVIPKDELEKINSYANFGIGKERAKVAGDMIRDEFGDFSRISYTNEIITSQDKQGFVIKVYR